MKRKILKSAAALIVGAVLILTAGCGGDAFDTYTTAYRNVMAKKGFDADLEGTFSMDGETKTVSGNFKVDDSGDKTILLLQVGLDGENITQFSDGEYLYTDARGTKTKNKLGEKSSQEDSRQDPEGGPNGGPDGGPGEQKSGPEFTVSDFLEEFASCMEAGKIKELGLLSPLEKNYVAKTTVNGNKYNLAVSDAVLSKVLEILSSSINMGGDSVTLSDLRDFNYEAVVEDKFVTSVTYSGKMTATVPASVSGTGEEKAYDLDMTIKATFNDPGSQVTITLPSTEGF